MFEPTRNKRLPYLTHYVEQDRAFLASQLRGFFDKHGCAIASASAVVLGGFPLLVGTGPLLERILLAGLYAFAGVFAVGMMALRDRKPKTRAQEELAQMKVILDAYQQALDAKRLHRDLDYEAAQLLEVTAYYWYAIHQELERAPWIGEHVPHHLNVVRQETLDAAVQIIRRASSLAIRCLAPAGANRTALDDVKDSLQDLDLDGLLQGFRQSLKGKKVYRSEHFDLVGDALHAAATDMRRLHEELVKTMTELARGEGAVAPVDLPVVEGALRGLRDLQQASRELRDEDEPRLRL